MSSSVKIAFAQNLAGAISPILVTVITVPLLIKILGADRFGVLSIVWLLVGYFGLLDLGLSRATANKIAKLESDSTNVTTVFWSAVWSNLALGILSGSILYFAALPFSSRAINISSSYRNEILDAAVWVALIVPVAMVGGVFVGALEARERFGSVNVTQVLGTVLVQFGSLVAAEWISPSLSVVVPWTILGRALPVVVQGFLAFQCLKIRAVSAPSLDELRGLFKFGSWVTVTSVIGPILVSVDQFVIGIMLSTAAVAHYSVPFSVVNRLNVVPQALMRAMFPKLSRASAHDIKRLETKALLPLCITLTALFSGISLAAPTLFRWWLGAEFGSISAPIAIIFLIGLWFNGLALLPFTRLQAQGRPDIPALGHLMQLVPYMLLLFGLIELFGIRGAAFAWSVRVFADAAYLYWQAGYEIRVLGPLLPGLAIFLSAVIFALLGPPLYWAILLWVVVLFLIAVWLKFVAPEFVRKGYEELARVRLLVLRGRA